MPYPRWAVLVLCLCSVAWAQANRVTVTTKLTELTEAPLSSRSYVTAQLTDCTSAPLLPGSSTIRGTGQWNFSPQGIATFSIARNDKIDCDGQNTSAYLVTIVSDGVKIWQRKFCFNTDTADLSTYPACTPTPPGPPVNFRGTWQAGTYKVYDMASNDGCTWESLFNNNTDEPSLSSSKWVKIACDGGGAELPDGNANLVLATPNGTSGQAALRALTGSDLAPALAAPPAIGGGTPGAGTFTALGAKSVNGVIDPTRSSGGDLGAKINAALATVTGSTKIQIPPTIDGSPYDMSTPVANTKSGVAFECAEQGTVINWTPQSGTAFKTDGTQRVAFRNCTVTTSAANSDAVCLQVGGTGYTANTQVDGWSCGVEDGQPHFAKGFWVTGSATQPSGNTRITNSHARNFLVCGFCFDHTIDPYWALVDAYALAPNATGARGVVIDTGTTGFQGSLAAVGNAGSIIQNSMPSTGPYGKPPNYVKFSASTLCDKSPQDGLVLAASLDTLSGPGNAYRGDEFTFSGVTCGSSGQGYGTGTPRNNIVVAGGTQVHFDEIKSRAADCNNVKITGGDHIYLRGGYARAGNQGNYAVNDVNCPNAAAVHLAANVGDVLIDGVDLRGTNSYESGAQKWGLYCDAGTGDYIRMFESDARNQQVGDVGCNATGSHNRFDAVASDGSVATFRTRVNFFGSTLYVDPNAGLPLVNFAPNSYLLTDPTARRASWTLDAVPNYLLGAGLFQIYSGTSLEALGPAHLAQGATFGSPGDPLFMEFGCQADTPSLDSGYDSALWCNSTDKTVRLLNGYSFFGATGGGAAVKVNGVDQGASVDLNPTVPSPDSGFSSVTWKYDGLGHVLAEFPTPLPFSVTDPVMDGVATPGVANAVAHSDHRHPTDTSRAADTAVVHKAGNENVAGIKTFLSPPVVPTPSGSTDAANKAYVDSHAGGAAAVPKFQINGGFLSGPKAFSVNGAAVSSNIVVNVSTNGAAI